MRAGALRTVSLWKQGACVPLKELGPFGITVELIFNSFVLARKDKDAL